METLKVISIRRYKERRHVEHEYLIAEVSVPDFDHLLDGRNQDLAQVVPVRRNQHMPNPFFSFAGSHNVLQYRFTFYTH
jgi:hypothetical protein